MQRTSAKLQQLFRQILQVNSKGLQVSASARKAESVSSNKPLAQRGHQQLASWTNVVEFLLQSPSQDAIDVANSCRKRVRCPEPSPNGTRSLDTTFRKVAEGFCEGESAVAATSEKACLGRSLKRPLRNRVICRAASSSTSQRCY